MDETDRQKISAHGFNRGSFDMLPDHVKNGFNRFFDQIYRWCAMVSMVGSIPSKPLKWFGGGGGVPAIPCGLILGLILVADIGIEMDFPNYMRRSYICRIIGYLLPLVNAGINQ